MDNLKDTYVKMHTNKFIIKDKEYLVTALARFKKSNDELINDTELDDKAVEMANNLYRRDKGLLKPEDIINYRQENDLSLSALSRKANISINKLRLYEAGLFPNQEDNYVLQELIKKV